MIVVGKLSVILHFLVVFFTVQIEKMSKGKQRKEKFFNTCKTGQFYGLYYHGERR